MEYNVTKMNAKKLHFNSNDGFNLSEQQIFFENSESLENVLEIIRPLPYLISDETMKVMKVVITDWICSFLCYLGILDNIITVIVFKNMGFQDTINISFTTIAFWDMAKGVFGAIPRLDAIMRLFSPAFAHTWYSYANIIVGWLYRNCSYASGALAAYVAIIRCLCVSKPLAVKSLLTVKVVTWSNVIISFTVFASLMLCQLRNNYVWVFDPRYNATVANNVLSSYSLNNSWMIKLDYILAIAYPIICFTIICICSAVILYYLRKSSKFRSSNKSTEGSQNPKNYSTRDRQVTKMLLVIIIVYVVAYIPRLLYYLTTMAIPEYNHRKHYRNIATLNGYIMYTFDLANAVINPFIFFLMSSHFRSTFIKMFRSSKKTK